MIVPPLPPCAPRPRPLNRMKTRSSSSQPSWNHFLCALRHSPLPNALARHDPHLPCLAYPSILPRVPSCLPPGLTPPPCCTGALHASPTSCLPMCVVPSRVLHAPVCVFSLPLPLSLLHPPSPPPCTRPQIVAWRSRGRLQTPGGGPLLRGAATYRGAPLYHTQPAASSLCLALLASSSIPLVRPSLIFSSFLVNRLRFFCWWVAGG